MLVSRVLLGFFYIDSVDYCGLILVSSPTRKLNGYLVSQITQTT